MRLSLEQIRQSLRLLKRHKRFTTLAILSLAIAIALNTTMYSVLDAMIDPKIAMHEPYRLHTLVYYGDYRRLIPVHEMNAVRNTFTFHEGAAGSMLVGGPMPPVVEYGERVREARVLSVSPNYFSMLGIVPSVGRLLAPNDVGLDARPVVMGERLWKQLFPDAIRFEAVSVFVDGEERRVVGLLPREADFPGRHTDIWQLASPAELAVMPLTLVRLKPDVTKEQAWVEIQLVNKRYREVTSEGWDAGFNLESAMLRPYRAGYFHWALVGSVAAVLLIACANLANLQLARGVSRARELATRAAVGASRSDIVSQLVLESSWLALGGLLLGGVLTAWGMHLVEAFMPPTVADYVTFPQMSWRVLLFAVLATVLCLVLMGLAPAIKLSRVDLDSLLKSGAGTGKTLSTRRQYGVLVVTEVALALSLLSSAALLLKSALQIHAYELSSPFKGMTRTYARVTAAGPNDRSTRRDWSERLVQRALATEGITGAATEVRQQPSRRAVSVYGTDGIPVSHYAPLFAYQVVSPEFFRVSRMPIIRGRDFSPGEFAEAQVIVDVAAATSLWPGQNPIGQQLKLDSLHTRGPWLRVIGVVGRQDEVFLSDQDISVRRARPDRFSGHAYVLNAGDTVRVAAMTNSRGRRIATVIPLWVRGRGDPKRIPMILKRGLEGMGANVHPGYPMTWEQAMGVEAQRARHDFMASLFVLFALFALALAALGVYGIIAHMVAQRAREFGVRIAIGAGDREIRGLVIREGNILTLAGIAIGLLITWRTTAWVRAFVFSDYDRYDSRVFAVVVLVLFGVAWLASYLPARRAMRINPVEALRND